MKRSAALLGATAIALFAAETSAWAPLDNTYPRWANMPVTYRINEASIPSSIAAFGKTRLDQGLAAWGEPACTVWATQNLGNTNATNNANDSQNVFLWRSGTWPGQLGDVNSVIGATLPVWDNNSEIYDADIVYNNVGFCWNDGGNNGCVDTLSIATHEDGHFLGLHHSDVSGSTMEPFYSGGNTIASIEQDDVDGVCALYPAQGSSVSSSSGGSATTCTSCANATTTNECKSQYSACGASQQCVSYFNCVKGCSSQTCADSCATQFPAGASLYEALNDCACNVCAAECSTQCGGNGGSSSSSSGGNSSSSGSAGTGGAGGEGGSTGAWTSDPEQPAVNPKNEGSCACSMEPAPVQFGAFLGAGALALAWARRRSRRA